MWNETVLQQLLLITDGCSNAGTDPVYVAQLARSKGIATSVIGILDEGSLGETGRREAQNIAEAGGGMCRIVKASELSKTMQMVTRQTMQLTLHHVVNSELRQLMGQDSDHLPPETRTKVASLVETMTEEVWMDLGLVIDVSASMNHKMTAVREATRDLEFGLNARSGSHRLTVITYPGTNGSLADVHHSIAAEGIADFIGAIRPTGNTPTGPALEIAMKALLNRESDDAPGSMRHYVV